MQISPPRCQQTRSIAESVPAPLPACSQGMMTVTKLTDYVDTPVISNLSIAFEVTLLRNGNPA